MTSPGLVVNFLIGSLTEQQDQIVRNKLARARKKSYYTDTPATGQATNQTRSLITLDRLRLVPLFVCPERGER